jgi:hypothetical protein
MSLLGTGLGGGPSAISKGNEAAERYLGVAVSTSNIKARVEDTLRCDFVGAHSFVVINSLHRRRGSGKYTGSRHLTSHGARADLGI